jgi:hypothetical protein
VVEYLHREEDGGSRCGFWRASSSLKVKFVR